MYFLGPDSSIAFVYEIKTRYLQQFVAPSSIKRGGSENSLYFNSLGMLPPEDLHNIPADDDDLVKMSDE